MQLDESIFCSVQPVAARRLLVAGVELFAAIGFHATTTREVAARAQLSSAALYVHYPSKTELLRTIIALGHESALETFMVGFVEGASPPERISIAVGEFAAWHARNQTLARVVNYELESLPREQRREIGELRTQFERTLSREIERGCQAGLFAVDELSGTATAIFSLCIDIARWYSPRRKRSPEEIGELYGLLALRMVGASARHLPSGASSPITPVSAS